MITVACVLRVDEGSRYSEEDVKKLKKGIEKFLSSDHKFVCLTNVEISGISSIPLIGNFKGWWSKLELFRKNLFSSDVFYIDLDMIICNELDSLISLCKSQKDFLMLNHFKDDTPGSGIMYWSKDYDYSYLWTKFIENSDEYIEKYNKHPNLGDQAFIRDNVKLSHFKDLKGFDSNWFQWLNYKDNIPHSACKILIGCGHKMKPSNPKFRKNHFVKKYWKDI